ncbi:hypothetical protein [Streptomyces sp. NPDC090298]|uniref:hypothetical protein n=1 Tax=Streptomyces sp. NPDC090298 TaxID=3365959 RepID=UPI0038279024
MEPGRLGVYLTAVVTALGVALVPQPGASAAVTDCAYTNSGLVPLNGLGTGTYKGLTGGLHPNGSDVRPAAHTNAGGHIAQNQVLSPNASGQVDLVNGKVRDNVHEVTEQDIVVARAAGADDEAVHDTVLSRPRSACPTATWTGSRRSHRRIRRSTWGSGRRWWRADTSAGPTRVV